MTWTSIPFSETSLFHTPPIPATRMQSAGGHLWSWDTPRHAPKSPQECWGHRHTVSWKGCTPRRPPLQIRFASCWGETKSIWQRLRWKHINRKMLARLHHASPSLTTYLPSPKMSSTIFWTWSWSSLAQGVMIPAFSLARTSERRWGKGRNDVQNSKFEPWSCGYVITSFL